MKKTVCVVVPHPDDETLGCGGTLLAYKKEGYEIVLIFVTDITPFDPKNDRTGLVDKVGKFYGAETYNLKLKPSSLTYSSLDGLIGKLREIFENHKPSRVFLPFPQDAHTDHYFAFKAATSCLKVFRAPWVEEVLCYETLSETNFSSPFEVPFKPNVYIDVTTVFDRKLEALQMYPSEFGKHPFPRSEESVKALGTLRGSEAGYLYAESFVLTYSRRFF